MSEALEKAGTRSISLDEIVPTKDCSPQAALKVLGVRREILDRIYTIREMEGRQLRHEGEAIQCDRRLKEEADLSNDRRMDLQGRKLEAIAKAELCIEKTKHYHLEIQQYLRCLVSDQKPRAGIRERLRQWLS